MQIFALFQICQSEMSAGLISDRLICKAKGRVSLAKIFEMNEGCLVSVYFCAFVL